MPRTPEVARRSTAPTVHFEESVTTEQPKSGNLQGKTVKDFQEVDRVLREKMQLGDRAYHKSRIYGATALAGGVASGASLLVGLVTCATLPTPANIAVGAIFLNGATVGATATVGCAGQQIRHARHGTHQYRLGSGFARCAHVLRRQSDIEVAYNLGITHGSERPDAVDRPISPNVSYVLDPLDAAERLVLETMAQEPNSYPPSTHSKRSASNQVAPVELEMRALFAPDNVV